MDADAVVLIIGGFIAFVAVVGAVMLGAIAGLKNWRRARGIV